jgi:chromatin remodeling complex protein RSC6
MESQTVTAKKSTKSAKSGKKTTKPKVEKEMAQEVAPATPAKKTTKAKKQVVVEEAAPVQEPEVVEEVVVQSSEEAIKNATNEFNFEEQLASLQLMIKEFRESTRDQLRVMDQSLKTLQKSHNLAVKNAKSNKKNKKSNNANTGAKMKMTISSPLMCEFLGIEVGGEASRAQAMTEFFRYAKEHGLQDQENKKNYKLDAKLRKLFPDHKELTHQQVMGAISPYFPKKNSTA